MQFKITRFEVRKIGEKDWEQLPEKKALEKLVDRFNPVTPIIAKMIH